MSLFVGFRKATDRKTECYWLDLFGISVLISYETPIAFDDGWRRLRQANHWGRTTNRHFSETDTKNWEVIEDSKDFQALLDQAILKRIMNDQDMVRQIVASAVTSKLVEGINVLA